MFEHCSASELDPVLVVWLELMLMQMTEVMVQLMS